MRPSNSGLSPKMSGRVIIVDEDGPPDTSTNRRYWGPSGFPAQAGGCQGAVSYRYQPSLPPIPEDRRYDHHPTAAKPGSNRWLILSDALSA
jgi:hypothetical protein